MIIFTIIICFSLNTISAANITVNDTSVGGINGALSSANSSDTIILQPGLYQGSNNTGLQISKNITIRGNGSPDQVKIDANFINQIFTTNGPSLNITFINVTFMNSNGGAMVDYQSGKITFNNCNFTGHVKGAITMGYNSDFEIINSTFSNNSADAGGAINNNGGILNVFNSVFINNSASVVGGAINNNNGHSNIINSTFIGNNASSDGGAIHISGNVDTNIVSSYFYNNTAISGVGGAIFSNAGNTNVTRSDFVNNTDGYGDGGAIGLDGGNVILNYNRFYDNNRTSNAYQVYFGGGTINADRNWWGDNDRAYYKTNSGIVYLTNYVVVDVEYDGPESGGSSSRFNYTIRLSDNSTFNPSLLPYFTLDVGTGSNPVLIPTWDARGNKTVIVNVPPYSTMVTFGVDDWRKVFWAVGAQIINLTVTKVANVVGDVVHGQVINYTITVINHGPNNATNVIVNEVLPSALVHQSNIPSVGTYNATTGVWTIGNLANGANARLVITVLVNGTGVIVNGVNVTANQTNVNNDTNGSNITVNITARPYVNLTLTKVANVVGDVVHGQVINYTITVINHGPDDATNVIVNEVLPPVLVHQSDISSVGTYNATTGVWTIGNLANGANARLVITVLVNGTGVIVNGVNVTANQTNVNSDTNGSNITANITARPYVNLTVTKVSNADVVINGQTINYTITVTNHGPDNATNVAVNEILPSSLIYVGDNSSGAYSPVTGVWYIGNLANGSSVALVITVRVNASTGGSSVTIVNGVNVSANQSNVNSDTNGSNVTANITVVPGVNLTVTKTANVTGDVVNGKLINYTIVVINHGPDNATNVKVNELLPSSLIHVGDNSSGTYNPVTGVWYIGNLANGSSAALVITVRVNASTGGINVIITNGVNVKSNENNTNNDTNGSNVTANITVVPGVNLTVTKTVNVTGDVVNGQLINYTIVVTNHGPDDATNVLVNEMLPSSLIYLNNSQGTAYDPATGVWNIGNLAIGQNVSLVITVRVNASTGGSSVTIVNGVNVSANQSNVNSDTNGSNVTANITVVPGVNLTVTKTVNVTGDIFDGQLINYTIVVTNHGPDDATNVIVNEVLPSALIYQSHSTGNGTYTPGTGVWAIGNLANGSSATLVITVLVNGTGVIVNGVNVTANENNTNNDTNGSNITANITARPYVNLTVTKVANADVVINGQTINYTITVTNHGPDNATNVAVNEILPSSLIYVGDNSSGAYDPVTGVWYIGNLTNGSSVSLLITVRVNVPTGGSNVTITNGVNVTADQSNVNNDTNGSNVTANITVVSGVNLTVTKTANVTGNVVNGKTISYTIVVTNHGPDNAIGVLVNEKLPNSLIYLNSVASKGVYDKDTGVWIVGNLDVGRSVTLVVTVRVNAVTGGSSVTIVNGVNVSANQSNVNNDTNGSNVTANITVIPGVNLTLIKTSNVTGNVVNGKTISYIIVVTNSGPDNATGVLVNEKLPNSLVYLGSIASKGVYNKYTGVWAIGNLDVGQSVTLVVTVRVNGTGVIINSVNVTSDQSNINSNTNNSNITSNITAIPDDNPNNNKTNENNTSASSVPMKKTGIPLVAIAVLMLFSCIGLEKIRKRD